MLDRILQLLALACLGAFIGVILIFVQETDLIVICSIVLVMAAYEFRLWAMLVGFAVNGLAIGFFGASSASIDIAVFAAAILIELGLILYKGRKAEPSAAR